MKLPSYASIAGDTHFPPIDNQGGIGSCASQSITHNQFSNAVSRYIHSQEVGSHYCPRDIASNRFSPKSTYNLAGAGTIWVYEILKDHGTLTVEETVFSKTEQGASRKEMDGKVIAQSAEWNVRPGEMETALTRRISGFQRIWFTTGPAKEKLTTSKAGLKLLDKIKKSVVEGNPVVTGGYPARWIYGKVDGCGNLSAKGEATVVAAAGNAGGGHQVTIVGYDDDITCEFGGVTLKGAFQIANSYGANWQNKGYTWMMYDAVNTVSEYPELNDSELYSGFMHLTPANMCMFPESLTDHNQLLRIEKMGTAVVGGKEYTSYSLYEEKCEQYVGYTSDAKDRTIFMTKERCPWVFLPYEDLCNLPNYNAEYYDEKFKNSYWVYAVNRDCQEDGMRFLDAGLAYASAGRSVQFATFNGSRYPAAKSYDVTSVAECFESKISCRAGKGESANRCWTLDQFAFMDWRKNVVLGRPSLYAKLEIETADRKSFNVTMTRTDKDGNKQTYVPALFRHLEHQPRYCQKDEYLTFSGLVNGESERGYFALPFGTLLNFEEGKTVDDYTFGMEITAKEGKSVSVYNVALCQADTTVIYLNEAGDKLCGETKAYTLK